MNNLYYTYDDMIKAVLEERERIIKILDSWDQYWGNYKIEVRKWWKIDRVKNLVELIREYVPKPSDIPGTLSQHEDEFLMELLNQWGGRIKEEEEELARLRAAQYYESDGEGKIDDYNSVWGGAGPDCSTLPCRRALPSVSFEILKKGK